MKNLDMRIYIPGWSYYIQSKRKKYRQKFTDNFYSIRIFHPVQVKTMILTYKENRKLGKYCIKNKANKRILYSNYYKEILSLI